MKENTILVPIDFSDCSLELVEKAAEAAIRREGQLLLLHVLDTPSGLSADTTIHPDGDAAGESVADYVQRHAEGRMQPYLDAARRAGIGARAIYRSGEVAPAILELADETHAGLIVMGTHGRTGVARALLGSVAEVVLRHARCPVTTVRTQYKPSCNAKGCAWCATHVAPELQTLQAEVDG